LYAPDCFVERIREREERYILFAERPVPRSKRDGQHHLGEGRHEVHQPKHSEHVKQLKSGDEVL